MEDAEGPCKGGVRRRRPRARCEGRTCPSPDPPFFSRHFGPPGGHPHSISWARPGNSTLRPVGRNKAGPPGAACRHTPVPSARETGKEPGFRSRPPARQGADGARAAGARADKDACPLGRRTVSPLVRKTRGQGWRKAYLVPWGRRTKTAPRNARRSDLPQEVPRSAPTVAFAVYTPHFPGGWTPLRASP